MALEKGRNLFKNLSEPLVARLEGINPATLTWLKVGLKFERNEPEADARGPKARSQGEPGHATQYHEALIEGTSPLAPNDL